MEHFRNVETAMTEPTTSLDLPAGVEVTGSILPGYDEILTWRTLELIATLHRQYDARRLELLAAREQRVRAIADDCTLRILEETRHIRRDTSSRVADPSAGREARRAATTGPTDRKMTCTA